MLTERSREKSFTKSGSRSKRLESSGESDRVENASNRINCILTVDSNTIVMGSHTGVIYVYDGHRNQKNKLPALPSSVLSLLHFQ